MDTIFRHLQTKILEQVDQKNNILLLGPRQTGKTTLINQIPCDNYLSLIDPRKRLRYEKDPALLIDEVQAITTNNAHLPLVIIDEIQKVPLIMDAIQDLIDRNIAQFILTGSSARKLRHGKYINLLPGRVISYHMDPFNYQECSDVKPALHDLLIYGSLPKILLTPSNELKDY